MTHITRTKSSRDDWGTPQELFDYFDEMFNFELDPCASDINHKCDKYFTKDFDGLEQDWEGMNAFVNPPYSEKDIWIKKCAEQCLKGSTIILIIPDTTDTKVWHDYVMKYADHIWFTKGRIKFVDPTGKGRSSNTRGTAIILFRLKSLNNGLKISSLDLKKI